MQAKEVNVPRQIKVYCRSETGMLPLYCSAGSVGADIKANILEGCSLEPGERIVVPTGLRLELPVGVEAQIRPRSGLAATHGITVLNAPGTIDPDYRGEVKVILINLGSEPFEITRGMRIAQLVFAETVKAEFSRRRELSITQRGERAFGSTGTRGGE